MSDNRYDNVLDHPQQWLTECQRRWLRPRRVFLRTAYTVLYVVNWVLIRLLFRFSVEGRRHLPVSGLFIMTPNHGSPFDPPILAAALPLTTLQQTFWAGKQSTVLRNRLRRFFSWLTRVIPIDEESDALAAAVAILEQGNHLIWFPEGKRSLDGQLQGFKPGIAHILTRCNIPVVPVFIDGAYAAFPTRAWLPRFRAKVVVRIGPPQSAQQLGLTSSAAEDIRRTVETLRQRVAELGDG